MRIIITQAEIEEAIKAHVLKQITIASNQTVQVNFKNTRGEDGATAEIDIAAAAHAPTTPVKRTPTTPSVKQEAPAEPKQADKVETPVEEEKASPEQAVAETAAVEQAVEETVTEEEAQQETAAAEPTEEATVTAPASQSLFASLKRPVNN